MLRSTILFISIVLILCSCTSVSLFVVNTLARTGNYTVHENLVYAEHALNKLDVYVPEQLPETNQTSKPVVIFFYGGCWGGCKTLNKEEYIFVAQALTSNGYVVVIADYQRYPEILFKEILADTAMVVEWVKKNIHNYNGDSNKLFLMGHSAGAQLAAMLTLNEEILKTETYSSIKGFIGLAGPYDFLPFTEPYQYAVFAPEDQYPISQPINFVDGTEPPLLLLYGNKDTTVFPKNIKNLRAKIKKAGGEVHTHIYDDIDHASILGALSIPFQNKEPILGDIISFLDQKSLSDSEAIREE